MKHRTLIILLLTVAAFGWRPPTEAPAPDTPVVEVLMALGEPAPAHYIAEVDSVKARMGRQMVYEGRAELPDGGYSNYISNIYVCTDCHNQRREDPVLAMPNPEDRLRYASEHDLPFLQSTTFWGMVNRESWYNDDYLQKYGDLVEPAKNSLYEATQLCARECSSGRYLEKWEAEAINHYYWTLQLQLGDLDLSDDELSFIAKAMDATNTDEKSEALKTLKSKYLLASPADFVEPPEDRWKGYADTQPGDPEIGRMIYDKSCMTCHRYGGPSLFVLDHSKKSYKLFAKNIWKDSPYALYDIVRHGTYAEPGHRQYMPLYTADRMSNQQLEDLRAFFLQAVE